MGVKLAIKGIFGKKENRSIESWQVIIFIFCWFCYALVYFGRQNLSAALSFIEEYYNSDRVTVGLIVSWFLITYAIGKLVNGYLGDKVNNKIMVFVNFLISGICNILIAFAPNVGTILVLWSINGIVQSAIWCNIIGIVSHWFYPEQHARLATWLSTSMVLGASLASGVSGIIIKKLPWQWVFIIPGAVIVIFSFLWLLITKNKAEDVGFEPIELFSRSGGTPQKKEPLLSFILTSGLLLITIAALAQGVIKDGVGFWGPTIMKDSFKLSDSTAALFVMIIPVVNFFGISSTALISKLFKGSDRKSCIFMMIIGLMSLVCLRFSMNLGSPFLGAILIAIASAAMYGVNTILLGVYPLRFASSGRASFVSGFLDFCSYLIAGAFSTLTGYLLDNNYGWNMVFLLWIGLIILGMVVLLFVPERKSVTE